MNELMKKVLKNTKNPYVDTLEKSELLDKSDPIVTEIHALNVILSGEVDGGFNCGITTIAGQSKNFKTLFGLNMCKAFLDKNPDGILVFFDSEFGSPRSYFNFFGKSGMERVMHYPVATVEELRTEMLNQIEGFERGDKVMFMVDSIGNLASIKETEDSLDGKSTVDMTRAKMIKSLFRLITARLIIKDIPLVVIGHTYQTLEKFSKQILGGGTGTIYASDTIIFVGKQQDKDGKDLLGYDFILKSEKSRFVREKMAIPVNVKYVGGIYKYSGMFDLAVKYEIILNPKQGWYEYKGKKLRRKEVEADDEMMKEIVADEKFKQLVQSEYQLDDVL